LLTDDSATSASEMPQNQSENNEVMDIGQCSSTDGTTSSESCAAVYATLDAELMPKTENVNEHCNEYNSSTGNALFEAEGDNPLLHLECSSESEFSTETPAFEKDYANSSKKKLSRTRPVISTSKNQASSLASKTRYHDFTYRQHKVSHYCTFCGKLLSPIGMHLFAAHADQPEVSRIYQLPLRSKERHDQLERLVVEGDSKHNQKVLQTGRGMMTLYQRPGSRSWVHCQLCRKLMKKSSMSKHCMSCKAKLNKTNVCNGNWKKSSFSEQQKSSYSQAQRTGKLSSHFTSCSHTAAREHEVQFILCDKLLTSRDVDSNVDDVLSLVLDGDDDNLQSVLTGDTLIRQYASLRMQSLGNQDCESSDDIYKLCQELRALARLVTECRRRMPSVDLYSLIHPDHFNLVITVSRKQTASVVDMLGRVVNIKVVDTLQRDDNVAARHAWNFRELYLLWRDSLADDDAVLRTDDTLQEERHRPADNRGQTLSQTFQQPDKVECNTEAEPESEIEYSVQDNTGFDEVKSTMLNNCSFVVEDSPEISTSVCEREPLSVIDIESSVVLDNHCCRVTEDNAQYLTLQASGSDISSHQEITISHSSGENSYCYYCGQHQPQIQHHWKTVHAKEKEVVEIESLTTEAARVRSVTILINRGNHRHNQQVLQDGRGTFLVSYRPKPGAKPGDYSSCSGCLSYMTSAELLRHRCKESRKSNKLTVGINGTSNSEVSSSARKISRLGVGHEGDGIQIVTYHALHGTKSHRCYFCRKWVTNVVRHWQLKHKNEPEVMEFVTLGKSDNEEKIKYAIQLRNLGIHEHNVQVLKQGHGQLFVTRFSQQLRPSGYLPCEYCWSYICKDYLHRHRCKYMAECDVAVSTSDAHFLLPTSENFHDQVSEMLDAMKDDNVKLVAESDSLIGEYIAKLLSLGIAKTAIIKKIRLLARFLMEIRKITGLCNTTLHDCISTENFQRCSLAVKSLDGHDPETSLCQTSASTVRLRNILRQISKLLKRDAVDRRDRDAVKDLDRFAQLCMSEWKFPEASPEETANSDMEPDSD